MKLSKNPCRIKGLELGELAFNRLASPPTFSATFRLIGEDGQAMGKVNVTSLSSMSQPTNLAMRTFLDLLESDVMSVIFEDEMKPVETPKGSDPQQV